MSRKRTDRIIIHCSATPPSMDIGSTEIDRWHRSRGFFKIGYHFVIRRDGSVEKGRERHEPGAHARGWNNRSVGICMIGGVAEGNRSKPNDNFTAHQWQALAELVTKLKHDYPAALVIGHNEVSDKACPSFDVQEWYLRALGEKQFEDPRCPTCGQPIHAS